MKTLDPLLRDVDAQIREAYIRGAQRVTSALDKGGHDAPIEARFLLVVGDEGLEPFMQEGAIRDFVPALAYPPRVRKLRGEFGYLASRGVSVIYDAEHKGAGIICGSGEYPVRLA